MDGWKTGGLGLEFEMASGMGRSGMWEFRGIREMIGLLDWGVDECMEFFGLGGELMG